MLKVDLVADWARGTAVAAATAADQAAAFAVEAKAIAELPAVHRGIAVAAILALHLATRPVHAA